MADWGQRTQLILRWDNRSTLSIAHLGGTWRSRHYAIRAQAVRELLALDLVKLEYAPNSRAVGRYTDEGLADPAGQGIPCAILH